MSHCSLHRRARLARVLVFALAAATLSLSVPAMAQTPRTAAPGARAANAPAFVALPGANVVTVVANDYAFEMPERLPAGLTTVRFRNKGKEFHHLMVVKLEEGKTIEDVMNIFKQQGPPPKWARPVGGPNAPAFDGETVFTSVLEAGNYVALCVIPSPGGPPHVMKGMIKAFTVTPSARKAPTPKADVRIALSDYDVTLSKPLTAGRHVVALTNTGAQSHEIFIAHLAPGKTAMDMAKFAENPVGAPPGMPMGGITDILPGDTVYLQMDVKAGEYAFICFTPDNKDGKPHLLHGMIKQIVVK